MLSSRLAFPARFPYFSANRLLARKMSSTNTNATTRSSDFVPLGPGCWLKKADTKVTDDDRKDPTLIIVFGWMGAKLPHIFKYTDTYSRLYPHATQILIQSYTSFYWAREATERAKLQPVAEALVALGSLTPPKEKQITDESITDVPRHRVLVHAFSNGGAEKMVTLGKALQDYEVPIPNTPSAVIIDSAPGTGGFQVMFQAFVLPIAGTLKRVLMTAFITGLWTMIGVKSLFGIKPPLVALQHNMWNPRVLPWMNGKTPRLYLYSKRDKIIPWKDVANHAEVARQKGMINVRTEVFEDTDHVAHARREPQRYWDSVRAVWDEANRQ